VRVVLAVAIHGGDDGACRREDGGAHRRALPAALIVAQVTQARISAGVDERLDLVGCGILAGVVDDDQLGEALRGHGRIRLLDEAPDVAGLI
jgi:hypothetical protein